MAVGADCLAVGADYNFEHVGADVNVTHHSILEMEMIDSTRPRIFLEAIHRKQYKCLIFRSNEKFLAPLTLSYTLLSTLVLTPIVYTTIRVYKKYTPYMHDSLTYITTPEYHLKTICLYCIFDGLHHKGSRLFAI